eukprot:CAMPEP_0179407750 /NCGR_PEP_ID=MMETSP0799-20121207/1693_1 /TAXON_ID=46947 /ORGANISM="Geminigera cryophila, Strain CCMP2564" /LENGTH=546 /DNA_ID=CAMNT_0021179099 /DNA_START=277 /DNA_END=1914 /DNA_ORIENTATION=-
MGVVTHHHARFGGGGWHGRAPILCLGLLLSLLLSDGCAPAQRLGRLAAPGHASKSSRVCCLSCSVAACEEASCPSPDLRLVAGSRLAKHAARPRKSSKTGAAHQKPARPGALPGRVEKNRTVKGPLQGVKIVPFAQTPPTLAATAVVGHEARDVTKALAGGCSDAELQALLDQVRTHHRYEKEDHVGQFDEWPPEPEFGEEDSAAKLVRLERSSLQQLAMLAERKPPSSAGRVAGATEDGDVAEGKLGSLLPRGSSVLEGEDTETDSEEDAVSGYTQDSESDEILTQPAGPAKAAPIPGCTRLEHVIPRPLVSGCNEESSIPESESSEAPSSEQHRAARRKWQYPEYSIANQLATDTVFQDKLSRWRLGLPNYERPPPIAPSHAEVPIAHGDDEEDDKYDYLYSHDDAAEPLDSADGDTLDPFFREGLLAPRRSTAATASALDDGVGAKRGRGGRGRGEEAARGGGRYFAERETAAAFRERVGMSTADFSRLRAVSKAVHHRRFWGVPPGTSFGVFDAWVNPYYKQPLRMRRISAAETALIDGRGW